MSGVSSGDLKHLRLRRDGRCAGCAAEQPAGTIASWRASDRTVWCVGCGRASSEQADVPAQRKPPSAGVAGASAQREYEKKAARREQAIRTQHPRLGRLVLALSQEPAHQRAWARGSAGERAVGATLNELVGDGLLVLHDRKMRKEDGRLSRANIDHLVVAPAGVFVVDAKAYSGALHVRRSGGWFSAQVEELWIAGHNKTALVHGVAGQVDAVRRELAAVGADVPVHGALCFVGTELPWFGSSSIAGIALVGRRGLARLVRTRGEFEEGDREQLHEYLARRFPAA